MQSLVASGDIKARTKWKDVYPKFKDDDRYINMLGNPGSNQIELFWDVVDTLDQKLDAKIAIVTNAIAKVDGPTKGDSEGKEDDDAPERSGLSITATTSEEEFLGVVKATLNEDVKSLSKEELHLIFGTVCASCMRLFFISQSRFQLHDAAVKKQADEKRRAERKQRHLQEDLRYALRKLTEPLDLNLSFEEVSSYWALISFLELKFVYIGCTSHRTSVRISSH